jgi:hypothetical protein
MRRGTVLFGSILHYRDVDGILYMPGSSSVLVQLPEDLAAAHVLTLGHLCVFFQFLVRTTVCCSLLCIESQLFSGERVRTHEHPHAQESLDQGDTLLGSRVQV